MQLKGTGLSLQTQTMAKVRKTEVVPYAVTGTCVGSSIWRLSEAALDDIVQVCTVASDSFVLARRNLEQQRSLRTQNPLHAAVEQQQTGV